MKKIRNIFAIMMIAIILMPQIATASDLTTTTSKTTFTDISTHWAKTTIEWGEGLGIILGFPDGTFKPDQTVTEAQFLTMLERTFATTKFTTATPWYKPYYDLATANNYPTGSNPDSVILRTQVAEIVAGTQGVNYSGDNAIQYLLGKGLAKGTDANNITIANYQGAKTLTRAEAIQFIKNLKGAGIQEIKARPIEASLVSDLPALPTQTNIGVVIKAQSTYTHETSFNHDLYDFICTDTAEIGYTADVIEIGTKNNRLLSFKCTNHPELNTYSDQYISNMDQTTTRAYFAVKGKGYGIPLTKGMILKYDVYDGNTKVDTLEFDL